MLTYDDVSVSADADKANCLTNYFESVFSKAVPQDMPGYSCPSYDSMPNIIVDSCGVLKLLQNLKTNAAPCPDGIPSIILKSCAPVLTMYLVLLFNLSLTYSVLPQDWKIGNVVPLRKSGPRNSVSNCRPISLTSVCCKILEHVLYSSIYRHLQNNTFFVDYQHGFRVEHSCSTQLIEFSHDVLQSYDRGRETNCILLDFQKAFDKVSRVFLMHKLSFLGLPKNILQWLHCDLNGSYQKVVNGTESAIKSVSSGLPQGSVLGHCYF